MGVKRLTEFILLVDEDLNDLQYEIISPNASITVSINSQKFIVS